MIQTNKIKSLQIEKTLKFLESNNYIFLLQWAPANSKKTSELKKRIKKIDENISLVKMKNSIVSQLKLESFPIIEGPNLFLGGNDLTKAGQIYALLKTTPNFLILGASIENVVYNHLELKIYFDSIYNQNVHMKLLTDLKYAMSIHSRIGLLNIGTNFQYVTHHLANLKQKQEQE